MCYDRRRAEACVDESAHHALANAGGREIVGRRFFGGLCYDFLANRAGICPHIAGQLIQIGTRGTRRAQKIGPPRVGRQGMSYATLIPTFFWFFLKNTRTKKIEERNSPKN
jgi:hypothetical protein